MPTKKTTAKPKRSKAKGVSKVTVKGAPATAAQKRAIDEILAEARRLGASRRVMIAVIMCATQESVIRPLKHGDGAGPDSRGYYQQRSPWGPEDDRLDAAKSTRMFLTGGKGGQPGWKQTHGSVKNGVGDLGSMITKVQVSVGGYTQWEDEATKTVDAWLKNPTLGAPGDGEDEEVTKRKPYKFSREKDEDSWTAITRLAEEVQWRAFSANGKLYYASETYLLQQRPVATITPTDPAILDGFSFDVDQGAPVNEISFACLADRWGLTPGRVVAVKEAGVADGRWLIASTSRSLFDERVEVTLTSARRAKKEPASETVTETIESTGSGTAGEGASAVYEEAMRISAKNYPYVWGGGHAHAGRPDGGTGRDPGTGYDCSGYVYACLAAGGYVPKGKPTGNSSTLMGLGKPGKGKEFTVWSNSGHTFIEFHGSGQYKSADTRRITNKSRGPHVHTAVGETAGFTPRHF